MSTTSTLLGTLANRLYLAGLFLLPTAVVFTYLVPVTTLKMGIAVVALVGALILTALGSFNRGAISIPVSLVVGAAWLLPITYLVSALFGPSLMWSVVGASLDMDTVFFMALIALSVSLPYALFEKRSDYLRAFFVLMVSALVVALYHVIRLFFGADVLSFGVATSPLFSPLGKWNDVAIFFGLVSLVSLISLESMNLKPLHRALVAGTLVVSAFLVAVVNFVPVWIALAVMSLGVLLYKFLLAPATTGRFSAASTLVFVLSVTMILFSSSLGARLTSAFGVQQIEARPSWGSTFEIGTKTLLATPITGSGPNTFILEWDKYRPLEINQSIFWNADFTSGVGLIPTSVITTGLIGTLAWLLLIGLFVWAGIRGLVLRAPSDEATYHLMMATFAGGLYTIAMSVVYLPSAQVALIGFAFVGMYAALFHRESGAQTLDIDFRERPRLGFVAVLGLAFALVGSVLTFYGVGTAVAATVEFQRASYAAQVEGNLDKAVTHLNDATALVPLDQYYRFGVLVHTAKLNAILNAGPNAGSREETQQKFQQELGLAVENGLAAVRLNPENYRNWATLGTAYQTVIPLNIDGSYEAATNALKRAEVLNPLMPTIPLTLAQIDVAKNKFDSARENLERAVEHKADFTPALTLLAQLELQKGNLAEAIKRAESAVVFEPSNPVLHFQVGVLKFENRDYKAARDSFMRSVTLAPDYANARFYLGRTYLMLKDTDSAKQAFQAVLKTNPDNTDVKGILNAINAGKDPFAPAKK